MAQEEKAQHAAKSRAALATRNQGELRIWSSIDDSISRLHLNATRQAIGDNITNGRGRFNRGNTNLSDESAMAENKHVGVGGETLASA